MATKLRAPTWKRYLYSYRPVKWTGPFIFVVCATRLLKDERNRLNLTTKFFLTYTTFKSPHAAAEWNSKARQYIYSTRAVSTTTKTVRLSHSKRH